MPPGIDVGSIFVRLGANFDIHGFRQYDQAVESASRKKLLKAELGGDFNKHAFNQYDKALIEAKSKAERAKQFKAKLGGDFDRRAFNQYNRALTESEKRTGLMSTATGRLGSSLKGTAKAAGVAAAAYLSIAGAKKSVDFTIEFGKAVLVLTRNLGLNIKQASDWAAVAKSRNIDLKQLQMGFTTLSRQVGASSLEYQKHQRQLDALGTSQADQLKRQQLLSDGAGKQSNAFKALGIDQKDLEAGTHDFNGLLLKVANGFGNLKGGTDRARLSQQLFGRGYQTIVPLFKEGAKGLNEQLDLAKKYHVELDGHTVKSVSGLIAAQREAKFATMGLQLAFGTSLAPTLTKVTYGVAHFIRGMRDGTGAGGKFADAIKVVGKILVTTGDVLSWFVRTEKKGLDTILGVVTTFMRGIATMAKGFGWVPGVGGKLNHMADSLNHAADNVDNFRNSLRELDPAVAKMGRLAQISTDVDRLRAKLSGLKKGTDDYRQTAGRLRDRQKDLNAALADASPSGQKAARGFANAKGSAVTMSTAVLNATGSIDKAINTLAHAAGLPSFHISDVPKLGSLKHPGQSKAGGGWLGAPGMVGQDTMPSVAPQGSVVLNRHQIPHADVWAQLAGMGGLSGIMASTHAGGGPMVPFVGAPGELILGPQAASAVNAALGASPFGGLGGLFGSITRKHFMAGGGSLTGMLKAANDLEAAHFPYVWGGGHQGSPAPFGPMDCSGAVSYVLQHGGIPIPTMTSGALANSGQGGPGPVTVFANARHTFMRIMGRYFGTSGSNPGGGAGWFPDPGSSYRSGFSMRHFMAMLLRVPPVQITGGKGSLYGRAAQGSVNYMRGIGDWWLNNQTSTSIGRGDLGDSGPGIRGRVSTFGPPLEAAGRTASGVSSAQPGIALRQRDFGALYRLVIGRHSGILPHTDWGPAAWTGRNIDVTGAGARTMGFDPRRFPTGAIGSAFPTLARRAGGGGLGGGSFVSGMPGGKGGAFVGGVVGRIRHRLAGLKRQVPETQHEIERADQRYAHFESVYNRSDEQFVIDKPDGTQVIDQDAVMHRLGELSSLIQLRQRIIGLYERYRKEVRKIIADIKKMIAALHKALKAAADKDRPGLHKQIDNAKGELQTWKETLVDLGFNLQDSQLDLGALRDEAAGLKSGTTVAGLVNPTSPDTTSSSADTSTTDNPDIQAQLAQAQVQIATLKETTRLGEAAVLAFNSPGNIGAGGAQTAAGEFGFVTGAGGAPGGGGAGGAVATQVGGHHHGSPGSGGINIYTLHPGDPETLRAVGDAAAAGFGFQSYVPKSREFSGA